MSGQQDMAGVDIGGSGVRCAVVRDEKVGGIERSYLRSRSVSSVVEAVASVVPNSAVLVGVGVPGFVRQGRVLSSPNFPEWRDVALRERLEHRLGRPVQVLNDANAACVGAWRQRSERSVLMLTLGTGVGGGAIQNGVLQLGGRHTGSELGHIYVGGDAPCGCGSTGCLETWASTVGLMRAAEACGHPIVDGAALVDHVHNGERWALDVLSEANTALARGLVSLVNLYAPDVVLLAGGLAQPGLWDDACKTFAQRVIACNRCEIEVLGAADGLAIVGAAYWANQQVNS